jgi:heme exporter protein A
MRVATEGLGLARGGRELFNNLSFEARAGAYVEVRGPNGSGKTSLLRALAGWLRPSAGRVLFDGVEEPALALAYLGHRDGLKGTISPRAHVRGWIDMLGGEPDRCGAVLEAVGLGGLGGAHARMMSQGQQRRLALARLIAAPRPIWLLDEPAAALDANGKALVAQLVSAHAHAGGIIIAAAHEPVLPNPDDVVELVG